jgi:N-acetylglutamate synthase-like GNAT family acetyltransferase
MELRQFNLRETTWSQDKKQILSLRRALSLKSDKEDLMAYHWIALDTNNISIGAIRLLPSGEIGFLVVSEDHRHQKVGESLLEQATERARHLVLDQVFLTSPNLTLAFFKKRGFDILHASSDAENTDSLKDYLMVKNQVAIETFGQRKVRTGDVLETQVRHYDTAEINWLQYEKLVRSLRRQVWTNELHVKDSSLTDDLDLHCKHFVSIKAGQLIGTLRMDLHGSISGFVVDSDFRFQGVGASLLDAAYIKAERLGLSCLSLEGSDTLQPFIKKVGFLQDVDDRIFYTRKIEDVTPLKQVTERKTVDVTAIHALGIKNDFLLLRRMEDFQNTILKMCKQAQHTIQILSPFLDHKLFDHEELRQVCSILARRNKYTRVEILLYDPHRVIKNGHSLVKLARRLPSSMQIQIVHPELRQLNHEYILVDGHGYIYRLDVEAFDGSANFYDVTEGNRLSRQFRRSWESSVRDPNLRQLKL